MTTFAKGVHHYRELPGEIRFTFNPSFWFFTLNNAVNKIFHAKVTSNIDINIFDIFKIGQNKPTLPFLHEEHAKNFISLVENELFFLNYIWR
jgi:hypothetical protein